MWRQTLKCFIEHLDLLGRIHVLAASSEVGFIYVCDTAINRNRSV